MTKVSVSPNLFVKGIEHPDQGVMNIGQTCHKCQQVDFLPFYCEYCKETFCSSHRTPVLHLCTRIPREKKPGSQKTSGPSAASLFPNREQDKLKLEQSLKSPKASGNILGHNNGRGNVMAKFAKFLSLQSTKRNAKKTSFFSTKARVPSRSVELANIRRAAKGDSKVSQEDRIYIYAIYINSPSNGDKSEDIEFSKLDVHEKRVPLWISKKWPVGRALDSIAERMGIQNTNNSSSDSAEKLYIFKSKDDKPLLMESSARCVAEVPQGETLYLVRGFL